MKFLVVNSHVPTSVQVMLPGQSEEGVNILSTHNREGTLQDLEVIAECCALCNSSATMVGEEWGRHDERVLMSLSSHLSSNVFTEGVSRVREITSDRNLEVIYTKVNYGDLQVTPFLIGRLQVLT